MYLITRSSSSSAPGHGADHAYRVLGPTEHIVFDQQYNELFTMHGTPMLLMFATPLFVGFANELVPLQDRRADVAFPRLNLLSYYCSPSVADPARQLPSPRAGPPRSAGTHTPADQRALLARHRRRHVDHGSGAVRFRHHPSAGSTSSTDDLLCVRQYDDVPDADVHLNTLLTSMLVLMAFPVLAAALTCARDRPQASATCLRTPPAAGLSCGRTCSGSSVIPRSIILAPALLRHRHRDSSRCSAAAAVRHKTLIAATTSIAGLSMTVWAHHMVHHRAVLLPFFSS